MSLDFENRLLDDAFSSGEQVGNYTLLDRLGRGGQAVVWSAWDSDHERVVAAKFIPKSEEASSPDESAFIYEAEVVSRLQHPNVLPLYGVGSTDQFDYLVMRYMCCGSVQDMLRGGPLPPEDVLLLTIQITDALQYIHQLDIVHRDLKPRNIMLDSNQRAYLTDFGLARPLSSTTQALHTGQGTVPYAPPEQHLKAQVSPASDIYSLGVMLYEMLTGRLPWDGHIALAIKQLNSSEELPDPREENPNLPPEMAAALRRLTAAEPENRPSSGREAMEIVAAAFTNGGGAVSETGRLDTTLGHYDEKRWAIDDAKFLLRKGVADRHWDSVPYRFNRTHYRFVDGVYSQHQNLVDRADVERREFMLRGALRYGHNVPFWWQAVKDQADGLKVCEQVIAHDGEAAAMRALELILGEPDATLKSDGALDALIDLAAEATEGQLRLDTLDVLGRAVGRSRGWREYGFTPAGDEKLVNLALSQLPQADRAARLLGRARSEGGVHALVDAQSGFYEDRVLPALMQVRAAAGSLPPSVPFTLRASVTGEFMRQQFVAEPITLIRAYVVTASGVALALGTHLFVTYRLPSFLDSARILNAVGGGLLFGLVIGLGFFLARWIADRMQVFQPALRIAIAIGLGSLVINLGFVSFHSLFLGAAPAGGLIALGSLMMASGIGIGGALLNPRGLRVLLGALTSGVALAFTWQIALRTTLSPMLYYEAGRAAQAALLIAISGLFIGLGTHAVALSIEES